MAKMPKAIEDVQLDDMESTTTVRGGCHCGAVRFEAQVGSIVSASCCNCSICRMCGFQHLIVPASRFNLIAGEQELHEYQFKTRTARHLFCRNCGIKSFYVPRSNPDGYSLNVRCLELPENSSLELTEFDGRNWSKNAAGLSHLSQET